MLNHLTKRIGQSALLGHNRVAVHDRRLGGDHVLPGCAAADKATRRTAIAKAILLLGLRR